MAGVEGVTEEGIAVVTGIGGVATGVGVGAGGATTGGVTGIGNTGRVGVDIGVAVGSIQPRENTSTISSIIK